MKVFFRSLNSCAMRKADIARYKRALTDAGHRITETLADSDVICVWTCAFRQDFRDNSLKVLRDMQATGKQVIACGCLPEIDPHRLFADFRGECLNWKSQERDMMRLFGVELKAAPRPLVEKALDLPLEEYQAKHPETKTMHCDQFIKLFISEGCPFQCTYCAEILAFPEHKSFPMDQIVSRCREAVDRYGGKHVVLHGDCVGAYGEDIGRSFSELLDTLIQEIPDILLGIRNLHPVHFRDNLDSIAGHIQDGRIFLLETPIQSASDRVLHKMGRFYTKADLIRLFDTLKRLRFSEWETHLIAGFPTETREEFQESVDLVCAYRPKYVLVSGFMPAPAIPAAAFHPQIEEHEKRSRTLEAYERIKAEGIICNYDMCELSKNRFDKPLIDQIQF